MNHGRLRGVAWGRRFMRGGLSQPECEASVRVITSSRLYFFFFFFSPFRCALGTEPYVAP